MNIIHDPLELQSLCRARRAQGKDIALVPTMGFLHEGHLSLLDEAARRADFCVASIFVNPTQFGPGEDLDTYPRALEQDCEKAEAHGVDLIFAPQPEAMYHPDHATWVEVPELAKVLCGETRPTHFRGVCTVVSKLLHLTDPTYAIFGQKDWQQLAIIRRMVRDLHFPVKIIGMPIVREADGLARSSRNVNLSDEERAQAPQIHAGLQAIQELVRSGEREAEALLASLRQHFTSHLPLGRIDYLALVHPDNLTPVARIKEPTLLAVAVQLSRARLIDNFLLEV